MQHNFQCQHHSQELNSQKQKHKLLISDQRINQAVSLLQSTFVSPYKIMYLLDPKQADHFKNRNQSVGCCSSNHITISDSECTRTERILKQFISYSFLVQNIDKILSYCQDRFQNIMVSGKKDNLEVTDQAEKYILDKVFMESVNNYIYLKMSEQIQKDSLWATPATWFQKYPKTLLNSIPNQLISDLCSKGWSIQPKYFQKSKVQITMQLTILQKDGKFQSSSWSRQSKSQIKILNNPQLYSQIVDSHQQYLFSTLRQIIILFSSFPFELNYKANLFCTINSNSHIYFCKGRLVTKQETGQLQYTVLANFGKTLDIIINQQKYLMEEGSLLFLNSNKTKYSIHAEGQDNLFIIRNQIGCVPKK